MRITSRPSTAEAHHATAGGTLGRSAKSIGPISGRGTVSGVRAAADPVERHEHALEHQGERQGGERRVDAGQADDGQAQHGADRRRDERAEHHGEQHGHAVARRRAERS